MLLQPRSVFCPRRQGRANQPHQYADVARGQGGASRCLLLCRQTHRAQLFCAPPNDCAEAMPGSEKQRQVTSSVCQRTNGMPYPEQTSAVVQKMDTSCTGLRSGGVRACVGTRRGAWRSGRNQSRAAAGRPSLASWTGGTGGHHARATPDGGDSQGCWAHLTAPAPRPRESLG